MTLPGRAQVVVVGGGIVGCSIAYHLTRRDVTDVLVLEQGQLTGGTTWHAAGLVSQLKSSHSLTRLATYSARLFEELEEEMEFDEEGELVVKTEAPAAAAEGDSAPAETPAAEDAGTDADG